LRKAEYFNCSLEQLKYGLAIEPQNLRSFREQGICLQWLALLSKRSHSLHRASVYYCKFFDLYLQDPATWELLDRVDKDTWVAAWRQPGKTPEQM